MELLPLISKRRVRLSRDEIEGAYAALGGSNRAAQPSTDLGRLSMLKRSRRGIEVLCKRHERRSRSHPSTEQREGGEGARAFAALTRVGSQRQ